MSARHDLCRHVMDAHDHVRGALVNWDAGNLSRVAESCKLLRMAVSDLTSARQAAQTRDAGSGETKEQLQEIRADIILMSRLVDSSSAFCRGMALSIGTATDSIADDLSSWCGVHG